MRRNDKYICAIFTLVFCLIYFQTDFIKPTQFNKQNIVNYNRYFENNISDITKNGSDCIEEMSDVDPTTQIMLSRVLKLREKCENYSSILNDHKWNRKWNLYRTMVPTLLIAQKYKLIYCQVYKAGSTEWRRLYQVFQGYQQNLDFTLKDRPLKQINRHQVGRFGYNSVLQFRDPLDRLLSAYRDKIVPLHPNINASFWELNIEILKDYNGQGLIKFNQMYPTFEQFVKFVLSDDTEKCGKRFWEPLHWADYFTLCSPCIIPYNYIIHMENSTAESNSILQLVGVPEHLRYPAKRNKKHSEIFAEFYSKLDPDLYKKLCEAFGRDYMVLTDGCPPQPTPN